MNRFLLVCLVLMMAFQTEAQYISGITEPDRTQAIINDASLTNIKYANTITAEELKTHLSIIASDEFEGRETGTEGNEMAAEYIALQFNSLNLPKIGDENSYFQDVYFNRTSWEKNEMRINGTSYRHLWDYMNFASSNEEMPEFSTNEVVFLGYGIDDEKYSDYRGNDLRGKVIMINKGEPMNSDSVSYLSGTRELSEWSMGLKKKLEAARRNGVKLVLIIENDIKKTLGSTDVFWFPHHYS